MQDEIKMHPSYWATHKKYWVEEFNTLDREIGDKVMAHPQSAEAKWLNRRVNVRIKDSLLTPA
jgi:hypothetical protein|tara:strand:+ start:72 stop:260 length:189 start_codon:yes stop_codon:yes gene_type:complete